MFVTASEGTAEVTNSEGFTVEEALDADGEYMDKLVASGNYEGDIFTQYDAYVKDQGAEACRPLCGQTQAF